jgi:hypothetical protein
MKRIKSTTVYIVEMSKEEIQIIIDLMKSYAINCCSGEELSLEEEEMLEHFEAMLDK